MSYKLLNFVLFVLFLFEILVDDLDASYLKEVNLNLVGGDLQ